MFLSEVGKLASAISEIAIHLCMHALVCATFVCDCEPMIIHKCAIFNIDYAIAVVTAKNTMCVKICCGMLGVGWRSAARSFAQCLLRIESVWGFFFGRLTQFIVFLLLLLCTNKTV